MPLPQSQELPQPVVGEPLPIEGPGPATGPTPAHAAMPLPQMQLPQPAVTGPMPQASGPGTSQMLSVALQAPPIPKPCSGPGSPEGLTSPQPAPTPLPDDVVSPPQPSPLPLTPEDEAPAPQPLPEGELPSTSKGHGYTINLGGVFATIFVLIVA